MKKNYAFFAVLHLSILIFSTAFAQKPETKSEEKINPESFQEDLLRKALLKKVNNYRVSQKLDTLIYEELLEKVAKDQSDYMDKKDEVTSEQSSGKKKDVGSRLKFYGGSNQAEELPAGQALSKGKEMMAYSEAAAQIFDKWVKGKKMQPLLVSSSNIFTGIGVTFDKLNRKIYVAEVFGGVKSFNFGAKKKKELAIPFTTKKFRLKKAEEKECKACDKFTDYDHLYDGLYVDKGNIYIKYDNLKAFKKLFKDPKDGLAVDIIQKAQYPCDKNYNITDNNLLSKGILIKRKFSKKIFKGNMVKDPKEKLKKLDVMLGKMPANLKEGDYEFNLEIIIGKRICKVISRKYKESGVVDSETPIDIIPDTSSAGSQAQFKPSAESTILQFIIPFQKNKADYHPDDIKPFITSLNEPDFIIDEIVISAFSSIEGDSVQNADLQKKRAESIFKSLETYEKEKTVKQVVMGDSWEEFKKLVVGTPHENLASMTKKEANKFMYEKNLLNEMEPILAKGRYGKIVMDVTFDIKGKKEYPYVLKTFEKAIKKGDVEQALSIQRFAFKKIFSGTYAAGAFTSIPIPNESKFAVLLLNNLWLEKKLKSDSLSDKYCSPIKNLVKLAPSEPAILFDGLFCALKQNSFTKAKQLDSIQTKIDGLYSSKINKKYLDGLNIEFQFKIIDMMDTAEVQSPLVAKSIEKIKKIYKIEESSWQNALKLSYIFARKKEYAFAAKLIEPFILQPKVGENLIYTYISISSYLPESLMLSNFNAALNRARVMNKKRYCELFGAPNLSFQVLDNPNIKKEYCKACQ
jgi:uncharacterized protein YkwD